MPTAQVVPVVEALSAQRQSAPLGAQWQGDTGLLPSTVQQFLWTVRDASSGDVILSNIRVAPSRTNATTIALHDGGPALADDTSTLRLFVSEVVAMDTNGFVHSRVDTQPYAVLSSSATVDCSSASVEFSTAAIGNGMNSTSIAWRPCSSAALPIFRQTLMVGTSIGTANVASHALPASATTLPSALSLADVVAANVTEPISSYMTLRTNGVHVDLSQP